MGDLTTNYGFYKADPAENYDVTVVNANLDLLDSEIKDREDEAATLRADVPSNWPRTKARANALQNFTHNVAAVVNLSAAVYEVENTVEVANNRIKILKPGWYICNARVEWTANAAGSRRLLLRKNTGQFAADYRAASPDGITVQNLTSEPTLFALNDLIDAFALQASGGTLATSNGAVDWPSLSVHWVGGV